MKGVVIHYSQRVDVARHPVLEPPRTRLEETVLDLAAAEATPARATAWILSACASRRTTPDRLRAAMESRPRIRGRKMLLAALGDARTGVESILEHSYLYRVERPHGLPDGVRQRRTLTGGVSRYEDVRYEEYGVIVELDGRGAHPEGERWRDIRRDNASAAKRVDHPPLLLCRRQGASVSGCRRDRPHTRRPRVHRWCAAVRPFVCAG